ncbi:hypothetical protein SAMN05661012_06649 [Chitinophaga sancti]|uniref:Uncharacterized protein n=1 Tax=Chitinophaga sancti TaxID=1004 RepID=A0A1K1T1Y4_9BACT|nr:hypothetical protein SAMN05661012_06649 [Chitinophaga sancti]
MLLDRTLNIYEFKAQFDDYYHFEFIDLNELLTMYLFSRAALPFLNYKNEVNLHVFLPGPTYTG